MASLNLLPQLFATTVVNGQAVLNQAATGSATNDSAQANASTPTAIGIQSLAPGDGLISIGAAGSVVGRSSGSQSAIAGSTNGGSDANASIGQTIGINQLSGDSIAVGSVGSILGTVELSQLSRATSVAASANADAITAAAYGINFDPVPGGSIRTGGDGSVQGLVQLNTSAVATTTGNAANDGATALQQLTTAAGLDLSGAAGPSVAIGGLGEVVGAVAVSGSATATASAQGNSSATAGTFDGAGTVGTLSGLRTTAASPAVQVAGDASLNGSVLADFSATATSVLGAAEAAVDGSAMAVGDSVTPMGGQISVGADGVYNASADLTSIARAGTTNGDATARIAPNAQSVIGTALDGAGVLGLSISGDGRLSSSATARQVGSSATTNGSATTSFGDPGVGGSTIYGLDTTDISVSGSTSGIDASAALIANGNATAVLGAASVQSLFGHGIQGSRGVQLTVGGDATAGIRSQAAADVRFNAASTNGNAEAQLIDAQARGIGDSGLSEKFVVGGTARLEAEARQAFQIAASSVNGDVAEATLGDVKTFSTENIGFRIGANGVIAAIASTSLDLEAINVGGSGGNGDAIARINSGPFNTEALRGVAGGSIGGQGGIEATAINTGRIAANTTNGDALARINAAGDITTVGISSLSSSALDSVSIGSSGDIQAAAHFQGNDGASTPFLLQATTTTGNADAMSQINTSARFDVVGINSFVAGSVISAGVASGNIDADATANIALRAASTTGNVGASFSDDSASTSPLINAIRDSDVRAGSVGRNRVDANAAFDLLQSAQTVNGNAVAGGRSTVLGIADNTTTASGGNTIQLSGDIAAQARFVNTALARTVQGAASSTATNDNVLGVDQYALTLIGSGSVTGAAHGLMRANAGSVSGSAQANAGL